MIYPKHLLASVTLALPLALSSCDRGAGSQSPASPLMIGTNVWPGYEPLYLARDLGLYEDETIRLVEYSSATQVIQAFRNGAIQAAALTLDEVLLLRQNKIDARVVLINDISSGGDVILGRPEMKSLADLEGKRVGVENTALGAFFLARALEVEGIPREKLQIVTLEVDEHEAAFLKGTIDAVVTFDPVRSRLLREGASLLFDSARIPDEIVDVVVMRQEDIVDREPQVRQMLDGWYGALDHFEHSTSDACSRMARRLNISPEEVEASYDGLRLPSREETLALLGGDKPRLTATAEGLLATMQETGILRGDVDLANLVNTVPISKTTPASGRPAAR